MLGISIGGCRTFRVTTLKPERFNSITVFPGWPKPADENRLQTTFQMPIHFLVGELECWWREKSELFYEKISKKSVTVYTEVVPGKDHMALHTFPV